MSRAQRPIIPLPNPASDRQATRAALRDALSGTGPAILIGEAPAASASLGAHDAAARSVIEHLVPDDVACVVRTSGTTGRPKHVALGAEALRASARASSIRLGVEGVWVLTLPAHYIAGAQVLIRSLLAGHDPIVSSVGARPFRPEQLSHALRDAPRGVPVLTSLVPTQLTRVLDDPLAAREIAAGYSAILVGGAPAPNELLDRAHTAGLNVVTTYGMSETCGGCVYDGVPLEGVEVRIDDSQRIELSGPMLAHGYLEDGQLRDMPPASPEQGAAASAGFGTAVDGSRWFTTSDLGEWWPEQPLLRVIGRADDVLISGGRKVHPAAVESALATVPGIAESVVFGVADPEWGSVVVAAIVIGQGWTGGGRPAAEDWRLVRGASPLAADREVIWPRRVLVVKELPKLSTGKVDRRAAATSFGPLPAHD